MRKIEEVALLDGATRVTRVSVRLGALSHFTPEHFREHFVDSSRGTIAEGAQVDAVVDGDIADARARDVVHRERRGRVPRDGGGVLMCLGSIAVLVETWDDGAAALGRLDDGCVVPLSFVPGAVSGAHLLLHLGIPVEVLDPAAAREALALRAVDADRNGAVA